MSHIVPYIPTEPPSIHDDSFEQQSSSSEISDYNFPKVPKVIESVVLKKNGPTKIDLNVEVNSLSDTFSEQSPCGLRRHINDVIEENDLRLDYTDSGIKEVDDDDVISQCSYEGQFENYINNVKDSIAFINPESMECIDTLDPSIISNNTAYTTNNFESCQRDNIVTNNNGVDDDMEFDEFGDFNLATEREVDYFTEKNENISQDNQYATFSFGAFDVTDSAYAIENQELDDDFDDFATFNNETVNNTVVNEQTYQSPHMSLNSGDAIHSIVESFRQKLIAKVESIETTLSVSDSSTNLSQIQSDSFISNIPLINEYGAQIWKELTNFDYSPAFIFHWMQSISYENFMNSMGPDYKELLSTQRATLPLYSVNLAPIEPVPVDCFVQNIHSTTSSSLDLTIPDKSGQSVSEKNSSIDIKNLEDEFIFNNNLTDDMSISNIKSDTTNRSSLPNLSSAVIQSEGLGGIFKSILKPLNSSKSSAAHKPMNPQAEAVLKELPDLSYMSSKVLMFPVLASCDIEDNI